MTLLKKKVFSALGFCGLLASLLMPTAVLAEDFLEDVDVGLRGYNRFTFGVPFINIIFPPDAPIAGDPVKLADEATLMFEVYPDATEPFQMIAHLANGDIITLNLHPNAHVPPTIWSNRHKLAAPDSARRPIQRPEDTWLNEVFKSAVQGRIPDGFVRVRPPKSGNVGGLNASYMAAFKNDSYILLVARLVSQQTAFIQPQDLYVPGVKAVVLDGDRVGGLDSPVAYILVSGRR